MTSERWKQIDELAQTISHYRILRKLGAGGMGEVYLAKDTTLDRRVAIKFLSQNSTAGEQASKRLVREARAAAALDHPHICGVHEVGEEAGHSFIVMQYVEGENLAERMKREPLPSDACAPSALHAHSTRARPPAAQPHVPCNEKTSSGKHVRDFACILLTPKLRARGGVNQIHLDVQRSSKRLHATSRRS